MNKIRTEYRVIHSELKKEYAINSRDVFMETSVFRKKYLIKEDWEMRLRGFETYEIAKKVMDNLIKADDRSPAGDWKEVTK